MSTEEKRKYDKVRYAANRDLLLAKTKAYQAANPEKKLEYNKQYREDNREKIKEYQRLHYLANKEKKLDYAKKNRKRRSETARVYRANRLATDTCYRLASRLRGRLYRAVRHIYKTGSAVRDLGCSIPALKAYLESKFQPGMSWSNYGRYGWHIDHIRPLILFDLSDRSQLLQACNYTNLQPLWAQDNLKKGRKIS